MRVTEPTDALRSAVKACQAAVAVKSTQPSLAGVYLSVDDTVLRLRTFDYETEVTAAVNSRVDEPGEALVSWRLLSSILAVATGATVAEVQQSIREAIELHLSGMREDGIPIPPPSSQVDYINVAA